MPSQDKHRQTIDLIVTVNCSGRVLKDKSYSSGGGCIGSFHLFVNDAISNGLSVCLTV